MANAPSAMMIHYSAAGLAVVIAAREKSLREAIRFLGKAGIAVLLGAGLASLYLVPAVYEEPWVNISAILSVGVRPQDNFLFTYLPDSDHNRFNLLVSLLALAEVAALSVAAWFARRAFRDENDGIRFDRSAWVLLAAWGTATAFVMLPISNFFWLHLPKFRFVQLPFRWLLCLNAPLALLLAVATARSTSAVWKWSSRAIACVSLLAALLVSGHRIQPPSWDQAADIQEMDDAVTDATGYEGTDEYVPAGDDPYELNKDLPQVSDASGAAVDVQMLAWSATEKHFTVLENDAKNLTLRLFNYPAWNVLVNGRRVATQSSEVTGLMIVPVAAGISDVRVSFMRTPDRLVGGVISGISIAIFAALWIGTLRFAREEL